MNVNELEAGPALDAQVAVEVMGWRVEHNPDDPSRAWVVRPDGVSMSLDRPGIDGSLCWAPSRDIAAAWEVIEKLRAPDRLPEVGANDDGTWFCDVMGLNNYDGTRTLWEPYAKASAATAPLAICRAALLAVEQK